MCPDIAVGHWPERPFASLPLGVTPWFYRTSAGAEIDLVIEQSGQRTYAIEIKWSTAPSVSKGFCVGCDDIGATERFVVYPGRESYPIANGVTVVSLTEMMDTLQHLF